MMSMQTVKDCILRCSPDEMLTAYLDCYGEKKKHEPDEAERANFLRLLAAVRRTEASDEGGRLAVRELEDKRLDVFMLTDEEEDFSLVLADWGLVLGLAVRPEHAHSVRIMAAVLYEMTWFGFEPEDTERYRESLDADDDEVKELFPNDETGLFDMLFSDDEEDGEI